MNGTIRILEGGQLAGPEPDHAVLDDYVVLAEPTDAAGGYALRRIAIPTRVRVAIDGLPQTITAELTFDTKAQQLNVSGLRVDAPGEGLFGGGRIPARALRAFQIDGLAEEVLRLCGRQVERHPDSHSTLIVGDPIEPSTARILARGRSKSSDSRRMMRAQVVSEYRKIRDEEPEGYPDTYAEIARRLHIGRTTVYRHLTDAGELGAKS